MPIYVDPTNISIKSSAGSSFANSKTAFLGIIFLMAKPLCFVSIEDRANLWPSVATPLSFLH